MLVTFKNDVSVFTLEPADTIMLTIRLLKPKQSQIFLLVLKFPRYAYLVNGFCCAKLFLTVRFINRQKENRKILTQIWELRDCNCQKLNNPAIN